MGFWRRLADKISPVTAVAQAVGGAKDLLQRFTNREEPPDWEALFIESDLGVELSQRWLDGLEKQRLTRDLPGAEAWLSAEMRRLVEPPAPVPVTGKPEVILLLGVNGGGKTTTAAKLAHQAHAAGRKVVLGAADTFRAAAVDQLQVWGDRVGVPVVSAPPGTDPASVAFRSYEAAQEADLLIVDTAGRLPNKNNLILELQKIERTLRKKAADAPHHRWLVVDGTSGGNILVQARAFHQAVGLTGMILSKYDASAKGGMIAAVRAELGIPTLYLGTGEGPDDLRPFSAEDYVRDFFGD
ncbi:MAG: signal recognition particle-docking protein FtsY [Verrucomicrobium sp.]|nr:signal recognition particle-docking protein FtsY [Verrucomicrobium sp.]